MVVAPPEQAGVGLVLMPVPGPPMLDLQGSAALSELVAKGGGGTLFLETDDCQASYDALRARGVEFNDPPTSQPYGIEHVVPRPVGQQHPAHPGARVRPIAGRRLTAGRLTIDPGEQEDRK